MKVRFSREAAKFLAKLSPQKAEKIREKLAYLVNALETEAVIPFNELDIKNLKGNWKGFLRMRIGKIRIIFNVDMESNSLQIYSIDFRGNYR